MGAFGTMMAAAAVAAVARVRTAHGSVRGVGARDEHRCCLADQGLPTATWASSHQSCCCAHHRAYRRARRHGRRRARRLARYRPVYNDRFPQASPASPEVPRAAVIGGLILGVPE